MNAFLQLMKLLGPHAQKVLLLVGFWDKLPKSARAGLEDTAKRFLRSHSTLARIDVAEDEARQLEQRATSVADKETCTSFVERAEQAKHALRLSGGLSARQQLRQRRLIRRQVNQLIVDVIEFAMRSGLEEPDGAHELGPARGDGNGFSREDSSMTSPDR